jgi:hypothetical protein
MNTKRMKSVLAVASAFALVGLAGCGGGDAAADTAESKAAFAGNPNAPEAQAERARAMAATQAQAQAQAQGAPKGAPQGGAQGAPAAPAAP